MNENRYPIYSVAQAIDRLPARARAKYDDLKATLADAEALQRSLQERIRTKEERASQLAHERDHSADGTAQTRLDAELARVRADLDKLERERSKRNSVRANTEQVISRINNFVGELFSGASDINPPPWPDAVPGPHESESVGDAILRLRSEISVARSELQRIKTAPLPASEVRAAIAAEVDRMAAAGTPRITVGPAGKVAIDWCDVQAFAAPGQARSAPSGSASQLACWWDRDAMIERLTAGIVDAPGSIPAAERPPRIRESELRLLALEIGEERLVVLALEQGLGIDRRLDVSPWAVLYSGVEEAVQAAAAE